MNSSNQQQQDADSQEDTLWLSKPHVNAGMMRCS
jgi:hypothetical protein